MTFLAPAAGLIAAAISVPALIALYLLKLRRTPVRVSSTLLWERATQEMQVNAPLRWLRRSLLLAIQLLALASLLLAIARPVVPGWGVDSPRVVFVIDRSASMSARDGVDLAALPAGAAPVTRLEKAKQRAIEMVREASRSSGGGGVMVVALASEALALTGLDASTADARAAIAGVTPTDQPAEPDRLFELLAALRAGESSEADTRVPTSVVIFSDGDLAPRETRSLPADISVRLERVGPAVVAAGAGAAGAAEIGAGVRNVGIVAINARRDHDDPEQLRVFTRVLNAGAKAVETTIELRLDGEVVDAKPITVPGRSAEAAGEVSVTFEPRRAEGLAVVRLGGADLLSSDDAAGLRVMAAARPGVVLVHPTGVAPDPAVKGLLEDLDLAWLGIIDAEAFERVASGLELVSGRGPAQIDLVVFDRVSASRTPTMPTLSFGAAPALAGVTFTAPGEGGSGGGAWRFVSWQRQHSLLRFASFDAVALAEPGVLVFAESGGAGAGAGADAGLARPLVLATGEAAGSDDGAGEQRPLVAVVERANLRHVVVAFSPSRSTWPAELSFPLFMQNAVDLLVTRSDAEGNGGTRGPRLTTDPVRVRAASGAKEIVVSGPLSRTVAVMAGADGVVELGEFELAGVYTLAGAAARETAVAVNLLDARETTAALVDTPRLPGVVSGDGSGGGNAGAGGDGTKGGREVWAWFVMAAFALATVEWWVYARRMRG